MQEHPNAKLKNDFRILWSQRHDSAQTNQKNLQNVKMRSENINSYVMLPHTTINSCQQYKQKCSNATLRNTL